MQLLEQRSTLPAYLLQLLLNKSKEGRKEKRRRRKKKNRREDKKRTTKKPNSISRLGVGPRMDVTNDWDVDYWYPLIPKETTFETLFLPLTREQMHGMISEDERDEELARSVGELIERLGGGAFVRLSSLSPKDAVKRDPKGLCELLKSRLTPAVLEGDYVNELLAINTAQYLACKVCNGREAMALFRRSDRIRNHLRNRLESGGATPRISIVVRRWMDIEPQFEFRAYVCGGRIVALSHYYKFLFVPAILLNSERILHSIVNFHKTKVVLPDLERYVCDFYVNPLGFDEVHCIELNPWAPNTSSALFTWDRLNELAAQTETPLLPEFAFLRAPIPNAATVISPFWRALLALARGQQGHQQERIEDVAQAKRLTKLAKKEIRAQSLVSQWHDGAISLLKVIQTRGFVTCPDLLCLGWPLINQSSVARDYTVPSCLFLLWGLSCNKKAVPPSSSPILSDAIWACARYLSQHGDLHHTIHNQAVWLKKELVGIEITN